MPLIFKTSTNLEKNCLKITVASVSLANMYLKGTYYVLVCIISIPMHLFHIMKLYNGNVKDSFVCGSR